MINQRTSYSMICRLDPSDGTESSKSSKSFSRYRPGYTKRPLSLPIGYEGYDKFLERQFPNLVGRTTFLEEENEIIKSGLLSIFLGETKSKKDQEKSAVAGLLIRCYLSHIILNTCKSLAHQVSTRIQITYHDLLPFVLNDDGMTLILLDSNKKSQLCLTTNGEIRANDYKVFSVEIIRTFDPSKGNLEPWAIKQTKQNPELKKFLLELGYSPSTDEAHLCKKTIPKAVKLLLQPDDDRVIEAFHEIYARDRIKLGQTGRCKPISDEQLKRMLDWLDQEGIYIKLNAVFKTRIESLKARIESLKARLKDIATILRQKIEFESWEPINPDNETFDNPDLPIQPPLELEDIFFEDMKQFWAGKLIEYLYDAIAQEIPRRTEDLKNRPQRAKYASLYLAGYRLLYCESMSITAIASQLFKTSQPTASRILDPLDLVKQVRYQVTVKLIQLLAETAERFDLAQMSNNPQWLKEIELYVDEKFALEAIAELQTGKPKAIAELQTGKAYLRNSLYAEQMRRYLNSVNKEKQNG